MSRAATQTAERRDRASPAILPPSCLGPRAASNDLRCSEGFERCPVRPMRKRFKCRASVASLEDGRRLVACLRFGQGPVLLLLAWPGTVHDPLASGMQELGDQAPVAAPPECSEHIKQTVGSPSVTPVPPASPRCSCGRHSCETQRREDSRTDPRPARPRDGCPAPPRVRRRRRPPRAPRARPAH